MIKKLLLLITTVVIALYMAAPTFLGFSLLNLGHAVNVATSMSAKLACSARFISGFEHKQIVEDLASYSPATKLVKLQYNNSPKSVTASLFGLATTTAKYRNGLGCSLEIGDTSNLDKVSVTANYMLEKSSANNDNTDNFIAINSEIQKALDKLINQDNQQGLNTRAMLVVKNGQVIAETYGDHITPQTPLLGWSMAKSVTAILIGRMQYLDLAEMSQTQLFSTWQNDQRNDLSLTHLLQMSSGLVFDETYAPGSDATHMLFTATSASDVALASPFSKVPGSHFSYSSGTTNILSRFIHQQLGNSTQADIKFIQQELFQPLSMEHSIFEVDSSGVLVGSSYLYASGRDWSKLGLLMVNKGRFNQQQLLSPEWVNAASTPNDSDNDKRYGFQFWLNRGEEVLRWPLLPEDAYAMLGNRKQSVMIIPSENTVLVRVGWTKGEYPMEQNYHQLLKLLKNTK